MAEDTPAFTSEGHKPVLIEDWLPIRELGIESVRERSISVDLPPLFALHVWWARAPLAAANGITLTALLPPWNDTLLDHVEGLSEALRRVRSYRTDLNDASSEMGDEDWYHYWVLWMSGVHGDPVEVMETAALHGSKPSWPWKQAFKNKPSIGDLRVLHDLLILRWGRLPRVADPTAGGGSIPFTAMRYGFPTWANDLNSVAVSVLEATLVAPYLDGGTGEVVEQIQKWGTLLVSRCNDRLEPFFSYDDPSEHVTGFIYANTVACPRTGGPVPLAPDWWLSKKDGGVAVRPIPVWSSSGQPSHVDFEVLDKPEDVGFDPSRGTQKGGRGLSPWDGQAIDSGYIKGEAQAGRMWPTLYAIAGRRRKASGRGWNRYFRTPSQADLRALREAEDELGRLLPNWEERGILPTEAIPTGNKTLEPLRMGITRWRDMFTPRQLLVFGVLADEWHRLADELRATGVENADPILSVLGLLQGKALNWNSRLTSWMVGKSQIRTVFDNHNFAFKWTFAEFDGRELLTWSFERGLLRAFKGTVDLLQPVAADGMLASERLPSDVPGPVVLSCGTAADLPHIEDRSIELVNIDPPYYQNVMYAELADFFYVWEKRTLGMLHPERFESDLTDKANEAVANEARFAHAKSRKKELAKYDYQQKMAAIFTEARRILTDDGVMVVWFTHKEADAWDALGTAIMDAGFTIEASWPVATQPEKALGHAKKNSAKSTVMLVCRKRPADSEGVFFEDIEADLRAAARQAVTKFEEEVGVGGVDLLLSTYGPTLSVIARNWPVLSSESDDDGRARRVKPEEALTIARQEVAGIRMRRLVGHEATFDASTDFWLLAWGTFKARTFPYDEARKLALGVGYDIDDAAANQLVKKRSGDVDMIQPTDRGRLLRRYIDDSGRFVSTIDAVHHMLNVYQEDGLAPARQWLVDSGYGSETEFRDVVQAAVNAVPRTRDNDGEFDLPEARALEDAIVALFDSGITIPADVEAEDEPEQTQMDLG